MEPTIAIGIAGLALTALSLLYTAVRGFRQADIARRKQIHDLELDVVKKDSLIQYLQAELADCKEERRGRRS